MNPKRKSERQCERNEQRLKTMKIVLNGPRKTHCSRGGSCGFKHRFKNGRKMGKETMARSTSEARRHSQGDRKRDSNGNVPVGPSSSGTSNKLVCYHFSKGHLPQMFTPHITKRMHMAIRVYSSTQAKPVTLNNGCNIARKMGERTE